MSYRSKAKWDSWKEEQEVYKNATLLAVRKKKSKLSSSVEVSQLIKQDCLKEKYYVWRNAKT